MQTTNWTGLYKNGWQNEIVPEAFAHPAKFSRALIRHIYEHAVSEGWLQEGDCVVDPFGGVALGGLDAMQLGLNWTGVELEPRFVDLGGQNIAAWNKRYQGKLPRWGEARLLQGDSRELAKLVQAAGACVSSPPYIDAINQSGEGPAGTGERHNRISTTEQAAKNIGMGYGSTPGQLGAMRAGSYDAAVSSPPWEKQQEGMELAKNPERIWGEGRVTIGRKNHGYQNQAEEENNLANSTGDTFWASARLIVDQVYSVLRPGGAAIWVVKAYVKNKQIVPFPDQWRQMCEAAGFVTLHEHRAWLVEDRGTQIDLEGNHHTKTVERKSFFRRLAEAKGSPRIDFETVLCMIKPGGEGGVAACISSPPFQDNNVNIGAVGDTPGMRQEIGGDKRNQSYGSTPGNLGNMKAGDFEEAKKP